MNIGCKQRATMQAVFQQNALYKNYEEGYIKIKNARQLMVGEISTYFIFYKLSVMKGFY